MDFTRKSRQRIERKPEFEDYEIRYPCNVLIYKNPPTEDIKIQEFEDLALERLKVLRIFDGASLKNLRFLSDDWKEYITAELNREGLKGYIRLFTGSTSAAGAKKELDLQARRRDYISHFILRLVYCRTQDLQRWFMKCEMEVFKYKFSQLGSNEIKQFLDLSNLQYVPLTEDQKDKVKDGLYESTTGQSVAKIEMLDFYKVHFTEVLDLIKSRRCYLKDGFAYVNTLDFISIIAVKQQEQIENGLQSASKLIGELENDERLLHLLKSLHTTYTGKDYALGNTSSVPIEALDQLSKKSFPLCMRVAHEHLRTTHHHKHGGRMQFGLFLKGIGVTLEDSLRFWREEFTKKIDAEKFEKSYAYNIRHNYGKVGSMVNYTPYSCMKIIQEKAGGPGECHGCPYKIYDAAALKMKLTGYGVGAAHVQEIMSLVAKGHFQLACGKYFQITHDSKVEIGVTHPNQYFEESQKLMGNREVGGSSGTTLSAKKVLKRKKEDKFNEADDDELWTVAETQETEYSTQQEKTAWDDDLDLTQIDSF